MIARKPLLLVCLLIAALLAACAAPPAPPPQPTSVPPTSTPVPATPMPTLLPGETFTLLELGLSFKAPAGWQRRTPEFVWTPNVNSKLRLGFNWVELVPPQEIQAALLPNHAQTLSSEEVTLPWATGRRVTLELYAPAAAGGGKAQVEALETHVLFQVQQGDRRLGLDFYTSAPTAAELAQLEPALQLVLDSVTLGAPMPVTETPALGATWSKLTDLTYGFSVRYPADWEARDLDLSGSGTPEDWPVKRTAILYPRAWAQYLAPGASPDPNAPVDAPPVLLEVCVGDDTQFRRAYAAPATSQELTVDGLEVLREEDTPGDGRIIRYVFYHPSRSDVRVVVSDQLSGFGARAKGNASMTLLVNAIVGSLRFDE